jgi:3-oxoacyl-[acyl-carrier protein] reductase
VRTAALEDLDDLGADYLRTVKASVPLGRLGSIGDIASAALFQASDEAADITGQTMVIDGGQNIPELLEAMG